MYGVHSATLGFQTPGDAGEAAQRRAQAIRALDDYPYLAEIATKLPESGYDNAVEFAWGLDLILDGLDRRRRTARRVTRCGRCSGSCPEPFIARPHTRSPLDALKQLVRSGNDPRWVPLLPVSQCPSS